MATAEMVGMLLALVHVVSSALAHTFLRKMNQGMHYIISPFYLGLSGIIFGAACISVVGTTLHVFYWRKTAMLIGGILLLWIGQVTMSVAYQKEKGGRVAVVRYGEVLLAFMADMLVFNLDTHVLHYLGAGLVLVSVVSVTWLKVVTKEKGN